jgi:hypothetical protein
MQVLTNAMKVLILMFTAADFSRLTPSSCKEMRTLASELPGLRGEREGRGQTLTLLRLDLRSIRLGRSDGRLTIGTALGLRR